jgi:hypothetical protein
VPAFRRTDPELAERCERILAAAPAATSGAAAAPAEAPAAADGAGVGVAAAAKQPPAPAPGAGPAAGAGPGDDAEGAAEQPEAAEAPPASAAAHARPPAPGADAAATPGAGTGSPAPPAAAAGAAAAAALKGRPMGNGAGPDVRLSPHTSLESTPFPQTPRGFTGSGVVGGSNSAGSLTPAAPLMDPNRAFQARPRARQRPPRARSHGQPQPGTVGARLAGRSVRTGGPGFSNRVWRYAGHIALFWVGIGGVPCCV